MRYVPAEILSLITTILPAIIVYNATGNRIAAALAGTWGGSVGYFGYILVNDIIIAQKRLDQLGKKYTAATFYKNVRALAIEFGVAELIDGFFIRPALMYFIPLFINNLSAGIIIAKFAADVTFYLPAIISYELSKKRFRNFE